MQHKREYQIIYTMRNGTTRAKMFFGTRDEAIACADNVPAGGVAGVAMRRTVIYDTRKAVR